MGSPFQDCSRYVTVLVCGQLTSMFIKRAFFTESLAINDEKIGDWRSRSDLEDLVRALEDKNLLFRRFPSNPCILAVVNCWTSPIYHDS